MPPSKLLTDPACKNAKPSARTRKLSDAQGMYLEITPAGAKYWRLKYRFDGKEKRLALGVYPEISLGEARELREAARKLLRGGVDPSTHKKSAAKARAQELENSFESVTRRWWQEWHRGRSPRHADYVVRRLEADVFPAIGKRHIADVRASELVRMAKTIADRGAIDMAKRALQTCGQVFRYAIAVELAERNPAAEIKPSDFLPTRERTNYARLEAAEIPQLLRKIEGYEGSAVTRLAMKVMALTFVRTSELIGARWDEFDFAGKQWRIPAHRMKMKQVHIVPLSRQALEVLGVLRTINGERPLLFPGERDRAKPMSNNTILAALKRMGYRGRMTGHGFRGVASTALHEMGYQHDHIERQLAHAPRDAVSASYNYAQYIKDRTIMMQAWADHLDALRSKGAVVPLRKKKAAA